MIKEITGGIETANKMVKKQQLTETFDILKPEEARDATDHRRLSIKLFVTHRTDTAYSLPYVYEHCYRCYLNEVCLSVCLSVCTWTPVSDSRLTVAHARILLPVELLKMSFLL